MTNPTHYNLIYCKNQITTFFNKLSKLEDNELYSAVLFCRKKYATDEQRQSLKFGDNAAFDRKLIKDNDAEKFYKTLQRYNIPLGAYTDPNGNEIPENVLALYMTTNPRCCKKATKELVHEIIEGNFQNDYNFRSVESQFKNKIQKFASRKVWCDLDIDTKKEGIFEDGVKQLNDMGIEPIKIETRGGWHLLVNIKEISNNNPKWHPELNKNFVTYWQDNLGLKTVIEMKNDTMAPIPGTIQGGFEVKLL